MKHALLILAVAFSLSAAEPVPDPKELPRISHTPAKDARKTFVVKEGFDLQLAAAEPLVADPVAMCFDEFGRLFVVEMIGYSERQHEKLGRVRRLVDTDGDGRFDQSTIFTKGLAWPTAVFCANGGVYVGVTPDLFFFKDTNGDGVSDVQKKIFTGFGKARLNVQGIFNSLRWGLDNRIHGATAHNGGDITQPGTDGKPVSLRGRDFSFDPRTHEFRAESSTAQHGMTFDDFGRKFVCSNSSHIQAIIYPARYAGRNPHYALPSQRLGIAADGAAAPVFRLSPDEPWRIVRTRWRIAKAVRGPVEGGGRVSGYFTAATGITIYRGDALGKLFAGTPSLPMPAAISSIANCCATTACNPLPCGPRTSKSVNSSPRLITGFAPCNSPTLPTDACMWPTCTAKPSSTRGPSRCRSRNISTSTAATTAAASGALRPRGSSHPNASCPVR
ncbi:MAG: PVC-type heme-binding CxxCH protein [Verrucomicrobiia bacterium]